MSDVTREDFQCCFCGANVAGDDPWLICLALSGPDDSRQGLWAHASCLRKVIHPSVPLLLPEEFDGPPA